MRNASRNLFCALLAFTWPVAASLGQSTPPISQQSTPPGQSSSQNPPPQTQSQTQAPTQDKQDPATDAARKAREKRAAAAKGKVFTEDDLSVLKGGVSVVGTEITKPIQSMPAKDEDADDAPNGEKYWRGKAQPILEKMASIDQQIAQLKEDIKKYGVGGIDVTTGMKEGVAFVEDRNAQVARLEKKKANLQKQLDDLEEEGRKAGAQPAWFR